MRDDKRLFSEYDRMLVAAVAALIIGVGVISAFPNGLHLSPSYAVCYTGTDTTLLLGDIDIDGAIVGTVGLHNITAWHIAIAGPVTIDAVGSAPKTFIDPDVTIRGGDGAVNGTMYVLPSLNPGAVAFNGSHGGTWAFSAEAIPLEVSPAATITLSDTSISINNGSWIGRGAFSLEMGGEASATIIADYCMVSTNDTIQLTVARSDCFNQTLLDVLGEKLPPLPLSLGGVAAVLPENGATIAVDGEEMTCDNLSLGRGSWTASLGRDVSLQGEAILLLVDASLYSPADAAIWFIPDNLLGLWPLAVGIWLVTSFLHRRYRQDRQEYDRGLYWLAIIIHVLALVVTFFLWDAEVRYLLGKSMLDATVAAISTGSTSLVAWTVAPLELVPWFIGLALVGLPIRIMLTAVFRLVGPDTLGGGVAKGAGLLALLFIGALYIPFFLNVTVLALLRNMLGL